MAIEQLWRLKPLFGTRRVIVVADRWYGTPEMLRASQDLSYSLLIRLKSNRKPWRTAVCRFKRGRPPQDDPLGHPVIYKTNKKKIKGKAAPAI